MKKKHDFYLVYNENLPDRQTCIETDKDVLYSNLHRLSERVSLNNHEKHDLADWYY